MIKFYFLLLLIIGSVHSFSQIPADTKLSKLKVRNTTEVGIVERSGSVVVQLLYQVNNGDTSYIVYYNGGFAGSRAMPSGFGFKETGGVFQSFYNALITAVKAEKGTKSSVQLDKKTIRLETKEKRGSKYVYVDIKRGGMFNLNEDDIQKLFGK